MGVKSKCETKHMKCLQKIWDCGTVFSTVVIFKAEAEGWVSLNVSTEQLHTVHKQHAD